MSSDMDMHGVKAAIHPDIIERYEQFISSQISSAYEPNPGTSSAHIKWMLGQLRNMQDQSKAMRWLGFIQGIMIAYRGYTTVEAERQFTRPYFKPLKLDAEGADAEPVAGKFVHHASAIDALNDSFYTEDDAPHPTKPEAPSHGGEDVTGEQVLNVAGRIQSILSDKLSIDEGEIVGTGPASYKIARLFKPAPISPVPVVDDAMLERTFKLGDRVRKIKGSSWQGRVVGFYCTNLTPVGYCVESEREPGSVQLYPEAALSGVPS